MILIAEPEQSIRESIEMILLDEGFSCKTASDFTSLIENLDQYEFDLIIADIYLLLNNIDKFHQLSSHPSILVMVPYEQLPNVLTFTTHEASSYILKPFLFDELLDKIRAMIHRSKQQ